MTLITKADIIDQLDDLPPETLAELQAFMAYLRFKSGKDGKQNIQLGGMWQDQPPITEQEIAAARQAMWSGFGERGP